MEQRLAATRLADGTEIAYALAGRGPLLVHAPGWLTHLEESWALPAERGFYEMLARGRTLVRYDKPGCGLSGPTPRPPSLDLEVDPGRRPRRGGRHRAGRAVRRLARGARRGGPRGDARRS